MQYINALRTATLPLFFFSLLLLSPNFICAMGPSTYATVHDAAQAGDILVVHDQLIKHAKTRKIHSVINSFDNQGHTLLTRALMGKSCRTDKTNNNMIQLLLECKADPNKTTQTGASPIRIAVDGGDFGVVGLLQEHGAQRPEDVTPGLLAAIQSLVSAVQTQGYLVKTQKIEIMRLERELNGCYERLAGQSYVSSDGGLQSELEEEEEEEEQDGPARQESSENPEIGSLQTPPLPRFTPRKASRSAPAIAPATQDWPARSKSPTGQAALGDEHDWELVEEQEGA